MSAEECDACREGCDVYECCVTGGGGRVVSWDYLCDRHRDHQGFHDCSPGCCLVCGGTGYKVPPTFAEHCADAVDLVEDHPGVEHMWLNAVASRPVEP